VASRGRGVADNESGPGRKERAVSERPGLVAVSKRGPIGATWWSQRFIAVLEAMGHGPRMTRGRSYARSGQVLDVSIRPGEVAASVQGSRRKPYSVLLEIDVYNPEQWSRVERELAGRAEYAAELLAGRMPERIDEVFARNGLTLFPVRREFHTDCTCPDWENPCKHVAAACYILAERLDADPFAMLQWRGRTRTALLRKIEALRDEEAWDEGGDEPQDAPLADLIDDYWQCAAPLPVAESPGSERGGPPALAGAVLDRLGPIGVEIDGTDLRDLLRPAYEAIARRT
jgi:uncharacterized Zn finger protein